MEDKYIKQLDKDYAMWLEDECSPNNKLEFVGSFVFDFTTYDGGEGSTLESLTKDMLEVLKVIYEKRNFEYIKEDKANLRYMTMVNMPFLKDKIEWGTSIRGAWLDEFNKKIEIDCGRIMITEKEFVQFIEQLFIWLKN